MITGSSSGHLAFWNLEERKLVSQMRNVHSGMPVDRYTVVENNFCAPKIPKNMVLSNRLFFQYYDSNMDCMFRSLLCYHYQIIFGIISLLLSFRR